jgi:hypothetical protein
VTHFGVYRDVILLERFSAPHSNKRLVRELSICLGRNASTLALFGILLFVAAMIVMTGEITTRALRRVFTSLGPDHKRYQTDRI